MVSRKTLTCDACSTEIITRTQIGYGDSQIHSFPCPGCGVGITYSLLLDQENASFDYDPEPENATWVDSELEAEHVVSFNTELLIPRFAVTHPQVTPFISAFGLFSDFRLFQRQELVRRDWRKDIWPITKRLPVHYENGNWHLFDSDAEKIGQQVEEDSVLSRLGLLQHVYDLPFGWMLYPDPSRCSRIDQRIALAESTSSSLMNQLTSDYLASGRTEELWHQLQAFHESFVHCFPYLSPLLQPKLYWGEQDPDLETYVVSDKRFGPLKTLYIDSFEIFCRLSVIALACEAIIHHHALEIPTKRGTFGLWSFEKLANAAKRDHLDKYPIADLFVPYMDTSLRNGIGHNSARYDSATDDVICIKQTGASLSEESLKYTIFCDRVLGLASALFHSEQYFFALVQNAEGNLKMTLNS